MPLTTQIQVVWTVVVMIIFLAIVFWAWSGRRKESFDEAANIPLEEENFLQEEIKSTEVNKENSNA
jgi:cytochrome c oxidase cbb3-type subunit 4